MSMKSQDKTLKPTPCIAGNSKLEELAAKQEWQTAILGYRTHPKNFNLRIFRVKTLKNPLPDTGMRVSSNRVLSSQEK